MMVFVPEKLLLEEFFFANAESITIFGAIQHPKN
jgi:hypothetical protein